MRKIISNERINKHKNLVTRYNNLSATHSYIFSVIENEKVYACAINNANDILYSVSKLETDSGSYKIRFEPNKKQNAIIKANSNDTRYICTVKELDEAAKTARSKSKGFAFENLVIKEWNGTPTKNNTNFDEGGDMVLNGIQYQIKSKKATFITEASLINKESQRARV